MALPQTVLGIGFGFTASQLPALIADRFGSGTSVVLMEPESDARQYSRIYGGTGMRVAGLMERAQATASDTQVMSAMEYEFAQVLGARSREELAAAELGIALFGSQQRFESRMTRWENIGRANEIEVIDVAAVLDESPALRHLAPAAAVRVREGRFDAVRSLQFLRERASVVPGTVIWRPRKMPSFRLEDRRLILSLDDGSEFAIDACVVAAGYGTPAVFGSFGISSTGMSQQEWVFLETRRNIGVHHPVVHWLGKGSFIASTSPGGIRVLPSAGPMGTRGGATPGIDNLEVGSSSLPESIESAMYRANCDVRHCVMVTSTRADGWTTGTSDFEPMLSRLAPGVIAVVAKRATFSTRAARNAVEALHEDVQSAEYESMSGHRYARFRPEDIPHDEIGVGTAETPAGAERDVA